MADQVIRTITFKGTSEGLDELINKVKDVAAAEKGLAVVTDDLTKSQISLEAKLRQQNLRLDENARALNNIEKETRLSQRGVEQGLKTNEQHARTVELINQRYGQVTTSTGRLTAASADLTKQTSRNAAEMLNLGRQVADVGVSLQAGQSLLVVGLQQGTQIIDVFASSGRTMGQIFGQVAGWAGRFVASTAGVVTGIGAIAAGALYAASSWAEGQREIDRALIGIGKRAGATRGEINAMAEASAAGARLSVSEWASGAAEFAKTGTIYKENFEGLNNLVKGFAATIGESTGEAQKQLAKIFGGEVTGAVDKLNSMYGSISGKTREYARDLEVAGKRQEAIAVIVRDITPAIQQATNVTGFWAASWDAVSNAASNAAGGIGKTLSAMTGIGDTPEAQLKRLEVQLKNGETALRQQLELAGQIGQALVPGLSLTSDAVMRLRAQVDALKTSLGKVEETNAFLKMGQDADTAVRSLLPHIDRLKQIEELQRKIREGQTQQHPDEGPGTQQGLGAFNAEAMRASEVLKMNIQATAAETDRANQYALNLAKAYETSNLAVAKTRAELRDQLRIAEAVGVTAQIQAQYYATINEQLRQGRTLTEAIAIAEDRRAIALAQIASQHAVTMVQLEGQLSVAQAITGAAQIQAQAAATYNNLLLQGLNHQQASAQAGIQMATAFAQVNSSAAQQLVHLRQQGELINASSDAERDRIKSAHTYNNLLDQGVDAMLAQKIASQELSNAEDERSRREEEAHDRAIANIKTRTDAWDAYKQGLISWSEANDEAGKILRRMEAAAEDAAHAINSLASSMWSAGQAALLANTAFVPFATTWASMGPTSLGTGGAFQGKQGLTQFDPKGYTSQTAQTQNALFLANRLYGEGGYNIQNRNGFVTTTPNAQGVEQQFNQLVAQMGGDFSRVAQNMLSSQEGITTGGLVDMTKVGLLNRTLELLPKDQQIQGYQQELQKLQQMPASLETSELIKSLTDKLADLTKATDENTSATSTMTDVLSPFYSSDPRRTNLGFRSFAGGGIMTEHGELPLRMYQGGGIATTPQVSVFGEGSTPEAYVPVPAGRIPVVLKTPANNNQRPINVTINVTGNADQSTVAALRTTAFQQAQAMRRVMA